MDIATIIGIIAGFGLISVAVFLGGSPAMFVSVSSLGIVAGGTLAATLINYQLKDVLSVVGPVRDAFLNRVTNPSVLIDTIIEYATIARRDGILALESRAAETDDEFLGKSIQLAVDGTSPELIRDILTTEVAFTEDRHNRGQSILLAMGTAAPAFGMIGTLVGLVQMLAGMDDPAQIGKGMAIALLTTLYGAILANVAFLPAAGKLKILTAGELLAKEITIEGILSIQSGDNPRVVEQKLKAFIAPGQRKQLENARV